jgi:hypothetical protein
LSAYLQLLDSFSEKQIFTKNTKAFTIIFTTGHAVVQLVQAVPYVPEGD